MLMCRKHWFKVPVNVRARVWNEYRPGQEITKDPSDAYLAVHHLAVAMVATKEGHDEDAATHMRFVEEYEAKVKARKEAKAGL